MHGAFAGPRGSARVMRASERPVVQKLHRLAIASIRSAPIRRQSLLGVYKRMWRRVGRVQMGVTEFGMKLDCDVVDFVPRTIFMFGTWEPNVTSVIGGALAPGDVFVDVGTNIGYYTLLGAKQVGAAGKVVAIEASPRIYQRLVANVALNDLENVRAVNMAVAERAGTLTVYAGPDYNSGVTSTMQGWRDGQAEAEVAALPLNEILQPDEIGRVSLIKIDIEGAERPILDQIVDTIHLYPERVQIIVECNPDGDLDAWRRTFAKFMEAGFHAFGVENDYSENGYLDAKPPFAPVRLREVPAEKMDILFTRRSQVS